MHFRLVGHQIRQRPAEPERLRRQVAAAAVALVEDQVDDCQHGREPVGQELRRRHPERDSCRLDLVLGPHEPLRHGGLADQERAGDLGRRQAAQGAQRERDLSFGAQGRMAAREEQFEPLVGKGRLVHGVLRSLTHFEQAGLRSERAIAANAIDCPVARSRHEPRARVGGDSVPGPALGRDRERLLRGFLGEIEIAEEADQGSEDIAPLVAEDPVEVRHHSWMGRTSTAPPMRAAGTRAARASAASRSSASKWK